MATRFWSVVFDANDHVALARFWSDALGWPFEETDEDTSYVRGPDERVPRLEFVPSTEPKVAKNRLHLDLSTASDEHYHATVERLLRLGARHADIGQREDVTWTVLADPEGNELCVLRPDKDYGRAAPIGTICLDADDVPAMANFWTAATGWPITRLDHVAVLHAGIGPTFVMGPKVAPKLGKNRLHIDVAPPVGGDQGAEVERLIALGARPVEIGQGDVPWVVLADPEDNEFCVLTPR